MIISLDFAFFFFTCQCLLIRAAVDLAFAYDRRDSVMAEICKVYCLELKKVLKMTLLFILTLI